MQVHSEVVKLTTLLNNVQKVFGTKTALDNMTMKYTEGNSVQPIPTDPLLGANYILVSAANNLVTLGCVCHSQCGEPSIAHI